MAKYANNIAVLHCCHEGCDKTIPAHRWGKIKASDWFFTKPTDLQPDGQQWCPSHHPEWVKKWRASR